MFEDANYRWKHDPNDGKYELEFDRFESTDNYHDQVVLFIYNEGEQFVGDVVLSTDDVPEIEPDDDFEVVIFHGVINDGKIVDLTYNRDLTEQQIKEARELYDRVQSTSDDDDDVDTDRTGER